MKPLDPEARSLVREWIAKAETDFEAAERLAPAVANSGRLREVVGFHCQQTVEKYLKALLTYYQVEFPKTHDIKVLLSLLSRVDREASDFLESARWLTPFGVTVRYPGDLAEMLPGDEVKALETARMVREAVSGILSGA